MFHKCSGQWDWNLLNACRTHTISYYPVEQENSYHGWSTYSPLTYRSEMRPYDQGLVSLNEALLTLISVGGTLGGGPGWAVIFLGPYDSAQLPLDKCERQAKYKKVTMHPWDWYFDLLISHEDQPTVGKYTINPRKYAKISIEKRPKPVASASATTHDLNKLRPKPLCEPRKRTLLLLIGLVV